MVLQDCVAFEEGCTLAKKVYQQHLPHCVLAKVCWVLNTVVVQYEKGKCHPVHLTVPKSIP